MTMTWTLSEVEGGTEVDLLHEGLPDVVPPEDNATGTGCRSPSSRRTSRGRRLA